MEHKFIKLMTDDLKGKGLTIFEKAVYSSLYCKYQYHNEAFYTYESFIAEELEISEKTVMRSIDKLQKLGLITVARRYNKETKKSVNYYTVNEPDGTYDESTKEEKEISVENNISMDSDQSPKEKKEEHAKITYLIEDYNRLQDAIEENYETTPEELFGNINSIYDIQYNLLESLSDIANTHPHIALDYIKEVRHIA